MKKSFRDSTGQEWTVSVTLPGSSNAMILFRHPNAESSHHDRYNWFISQGPEARSVTSRLDPEKVASQLTDEQVKRLFARSMPVSRPIPPTRKT